MAKRSIGLKEFHSHASNPAVRDHVSIEFKLATNAAAVDDRVVSFVFSDDSIDSYNDRIDAKGWVYDRSGAGTIALFGHDPSEVANIIGRAHNVRVEGNQLIGDIHFADKDVNPDADRVLRLVQAGILNSCSVGFQPLEWTLAKDKSRPGGVDFLKQKLLEISIVGIPANENAVALQLAREAGIQIDDDWFNRSSEPDLQQAPAFITLMRAALKAREPGFTKKDLYSVGWLAQLLEDMGFIQDMTAWEAEWEGDGSAIPARLLDAMKTLGQILVDMTIEEVSELFDVDTSLDGDGFIELVELAAPTPSQSAVLMLARLAAGTPSVRIMQSPRDKSGRVFSAANETTLRSVRAAASTMCDDLDGLLAALDPEAEKSNADPEHAARLRDLDLMAVPRH